jgi:hypothetical protein
MQTRIYRKKCVNGSKKCKKLKKTRRIFWPTSIHSCHQKPNPARETVPLTAWPFLGCCSVHHGCSSCFGGLARPTRPARRACWLRTTLRPGFQKLQLPGLSSTSRTCPALRPLPNPGCLSALCQLPTLFRLHALRRGI